jgi:putative flippase GtrA
MPEGSPAPDPAVRPALNLPPVLRFAITGVGNSVVGFAVLLLALRLGFTDIAANLTGFAAGLTVGFIANRHWTFAVEGQISAAEVLRYLAGFALAWCLNIAVVMIGIRAGHAGSPLIHLAGIVVYSATFYVVSRSFVFVPRPQTDSPQDLLGELIVLPGAALLAVVMRNLPLTHDVIWQLWIARQMLGGAELYSQINEINPPLWFWMGMPLHLLARACALPAPMILVWFILLLALASALLVGRIGRFESPRERALAMVMTLVIGLFTSIYDFAQREQILLIGAIPYALLIAARIRGERPSVPLGAAIGVLASLGFALKHYFVLAPLGLELLLAWHLRRAWRPLRTETLILAVLGCAYATAVLVLTPAFLTVMVPMVQAAYFGFETPVWMWFDETIQALWLLELVALASLGAPRLIRKRPEMQALAICVLAFLATYLLQRKGWQYHAMATSGMLLMLLSSLGWAHGQRLAQLTAKPLVCVIIVLHLAFSFFQRPYDNEREPFIARYIDHTPQGSAVLIMASNPMWGWPAVEHRHRVWASRYGALWMLPAFGRARADHTMTPTLAALERTVRVENHADMVCAAPGLILIENHEPNFLSRPVDFDTLAFFSQDKPFRDYLDANYRLIDNGFYLRAYLRTTPAPRVRPASCRPVTPPFGTEWEVAGPA